VKAQKVYLDSEVSLPPFGLLQSARVLVFGRISNGNLLECGLYMVSEDAKVKESLFSNWQL
jgi:hypothetical protein